MQIVEIEDDDEAMEQLVVAIDFGTTNSLIAISRDNKPEIIKDINGSEIIETVSLSRIRSIKRLFGKTVPEILENSTLLNLVGDKMDTSSTQLVRLNIDGKFKTLPEIASQIFISLKHQAELYLKSEVKKAVLTVPAHFDDVARGQVVLAAKIAGLEVLRLVTEPTAAAVCYGLQRDKGGCYVVYDFGGGTFDASVLQMFKGVFRVAATNGDGILGGDDIDNVVAKYFASNYDVSNIPGLLKIAKEAKEWLTHNDYFTHSGFSLSLEKFNELILPLIARTIEITQDTIAETYLHDVNGLILVGGSSRVPLVKKMLQKSFNIPIFDDVDPDKSVVFGAALHAQNLSKHGSNNSLLVDAVPLSLGIELYGGLVERVICKNMFTPISITKHFTTQFDNQTSIKIHVVQGERELVKDLRSLAVFTLKNLPEMKAGAIKLEVTFSVDVNGILSVSAFEKTSGLSHIVEVNPTYGLSDEQCNEILEQAYKNAETDHQERLRQETILKSESLIYDIKNSITDVPDILSQDEVDELFSSMSILENSIKSGVREDIYSDYKNFEYVAQKFLTKRLNHITSGLLKGKYVDEI